MSIELDDIDLKILQSLQEDGRISHAALGKAVGLTGPSVYARILRLEREGVIKRYTTFFDPDKIGQHVVAFVRVTTRTAFSDAEQEGFEQFVMKEPQILECHDVDGEDSYILKIRTSSPQTLRQLLKELRMLPFVARTVTSIALATIKESGLTIPLPSPIEGPGPTEPGNTT
ncbi:Lrp/AsnC family transcriptional regulator [Ktedonosporobacter rubrisoli]|uniref:Lrp/AsnC family transcriptional regulator n=1 Tax=Ktedonosporobacter rubrisoli TaxID=2509675 RepID=A0A4P6JRF4_KTERU|nr:Lrp/AsnC family transcriptional regulator [Ktedonosporobacter rubrisoli]QBD78038.1 Lrp/AsnC family transcriptional regulator [Ktedonosporobacter rubrisoli]